MSVQSAKTDIKLTIVYSPLKLCITWQNYEWVRQALCSVIFDLFNGMEPFGVLTLLVEPQ